MHAKAFQKYAGDVSTNVIGAIVIAIFVAIGGTLLTYLGSVWAKPLLVGGGMGLLTLLILLAVKAIRAMPSLPEPTTPENIKARCLAWVEAFGLTVAMNKPAGTHFRLEVAVNSRLIGIAHPTDGLDYLHLFANITPDSDDKKSLSTLNEAEKAATMVALKLELARARMGYSGLSLDGFTIFKKMPIKPDLSEATFIEGIWEMEAMINALFMVAASINIKNEEVAKLITDKKDNEIPGYIEGPEALKKFDDGMKGIFTAPKPGKSPFKPPAKPKPTSKD